MGSNLFPEWSARLGSPSSPEEALDDFKAMARKDAGPDDEFPVLPAINPRSPGAKPLRIHFDLTEPKGDHDHCLYKSDEDDDGRKHAGQRRPHDYQPDRAERIGFIPEALARPEFVYHHKQTPWRLLYVSRTGPDEFVIVVVHVREKGQPRYRFVTMHTTTLAKLGAKRKGWVRAYTRG